MRVLIALRISNETDTSTSLERQLHDCTAYVNERQHLGWQVVGVARDAHISATKSHPKATEEEIAALYEEHDSLAAEGDKPDRYEYRDTGETFRHMWERNKGNEVERTRHLLKAGITIRLNPLTKGVSNTTDFGGEVDLGNRSEPFTIH
ncbi:recombinase family protein [Streptomyces scopuliridis]|uniref:Recombinase family protein n=1 Tax=Streptomyces scopuliridis TaxID=452529 RepID=A0ACD4ZIH1_9ACTN|nr:recombinase family protein [Streptomyces scopuliridis]WSB33973.1 recombinase family protein [Streptomyces scopuliridis]WSB98255.1 recombinase family protein [Streptomyces scopuliridis]WSC08043.1 recombinase family protein [Streptomyces scopuliridis]